jgi:hypothetical protein
MTDWIFGGLFDKAVVFVLYDRGGQTYRPLGAACNNFPKFGNLKQAWVHTYI